MPQERFARLVHRTHQLHDVVEKLNYDVGLISDERFVLSYRAGLLSFEHAKAALLLLENNLQSPALSLYRPQFESLVRGIWLLHAASDEWIEKLSSPVNEDNFKKANQSQMLADMLKQLDNSSAPQHLIDELKNYRDAAWKALNSYAHSGFLPLALAEIDYPPEIGIDAILNSNALVSINAQLFIIVSGEHEKITQVSDILKNFKDCIPIL